jgi:hypothetical protein
MDVWNLNKLQAMQFFLKAVKVIYILKAFAATECNKTLPG